MGLQFKYYSPCISSPNMNRLISDLNIISCSNAFESEEEMEQDLVIMEEEVYSYKDELYCSYIEEIKYVLEPYFTSLWMTKEQAEYLINIETEREKRVLPRYVFDNELLSKTENFCWNHYYRYNINSYISEIYNNNEYKVYTDDVGLVKYLIEKNIGKANDPRKELDFHEILTCDDKLFTQINENLTKLHSVIEKTNPFLDAEKNVLFQNKSIAGNNDIVDYVSIIDKLNLYQDKQYAKDFLKNSVNDFFHDYTIYSISNSWSHARLLQIKHKYIQLYFEEIENGITRESNYAFYKIGKKFKIRFNNNELPESELTGLSYIYYLVGNQDKSFPYDELDNLKNKPLPFDINKTYSVLDTKFGHDNFILETKKINYEDMEHIDGRHIFELADYEASVSYKEEFEILKDKLKKAKSKNDIDEANNIDNEIKRLLLFVRESVDGKWIPKEVRGEYVRVEKKIDKSINDACVWMMEQGFEKAAVHFRKSIRRKNNELSYVSSDGQIKWYMY